MFWYVLQKIYIYYVYIITVYYRSHFWLIQSFNQDGSRHIKSVKNIASYCWTDKEIQYLKGVLTDLKNTWIIAKLSICKHILYDRVLACILFLLKCLIWQLFQLKRQLDQINWSYNLSFVHKLTRVVIHGLKAQNDELSS